MLSFIPHSALGLTPFILIGAFLLDIAMGDPRWLPHPVRIIGKAITGYELLLRGHLKTHSAERLGGALLVVLITVPTFIIILMVCRGSVWVSHNVSMLLGVLTIIYMTSTTIAIRELVKSARLVIDSVKQRRLYMARCKLSMIVGRDTDCLSEKEILKATMETLAENLSDGIIAPLFYLAIGGLPLAMTYKAINTLDSMVGYKNDKYIHFGWAAARLDDIVNYIPARITGILIVIASFILSRSFSILRSSFKTMLSDGMKHPSPNSGIPEAAIAGALGISLGGPSTYGGILVEKPYIGVGSREDYLAASESAISIVKTTSTLGIGITVIILLLMRAFI